MLGDVAEILFAFPLYSDLTVTVYFPCMSLYRSYLAPGSFKYACARRVFSPIYLARYCYILVDFRGVLFLPLFHEDDII